MSSSSSFFQQLGQQLSAWLRDHSVCALPCNQEAALTLDPDSGWSTVAGANLALWPSRENPAAAWPAKAWTAPFAIDHDTSLLPFSTLPVVALRLSTLVPGQPERWKRYAMEELGTLVALWPTLRDPSVVAHVQLSAECCTPTTGLSDLSRRATTRVVLVARSSDEHERQLNTHLLQQNLPSEWAVPGAEATRVPAYANLARRPTLTAMNKSALRAAARLRAAYRDEPYALRL